MKSSSNYWKSITKHTKKPISPHPSWINVLTTTRFHNWIKVLTTTRFYSSAWPCRFAAGKNDETAGWGFSFAQTGYVDSISLDISMMMTQIKSAFLATAIIGNWLTILRCLCLCLLPCLNTELCLQMTELLLCKAVKGWTPWFCSHQQRVGGGKNKAYDTSYLLYLWQFSTHFGLGFFAFLMEKYTLGEKITPKRPVKRPIESIRGRAPKAQGSGSNFFFSRGGQGGGPFKNFLLNFIGYYK